MTKSKLKTLVEELLKQGDYDETIYALQCHDEDTTIDPAARKAIKKVLNAGEYDEQVYALEDLNTLLSR